MTFALFGRTWGLILIEALLVGLAVLISLLAPKVLSKLFYRIEAALSSAARRPWRAVLIAALAPLVVRALFLPIYPVPSPRVHDDFSYLLLGSTFSSGRVTNPTPPMWEHFESIYIFLTPTYSSQYQPAQGLVLAAGQVLTGNPWWGAYASMGIAFGTLCWALGQSVPWRWALLASLLGAMQFGVLGLWMNSYFGGAVALTAGSLVFGGVLQLRKRPRIGPAVCVAVGLVLLGASRPLEAVIWGAASILLLIPARPPLRILVPGALVLMAGATGLLWYNWRVTGNALEPPYMHNLKLYGTPQPFYWQRPLIIANFRYPELRDIYQFQRAMYIRRTSLPEMLRGMYDRLKDVWFFYVGPVLLIPLFWAMFLWKDRRVLLWLPAIGLFVLGHITFHVWYPQHSAPEVVLMALVFVECWRRLRLFRIYDRPVGMALTRLLPVCGCIGLLIPIAGRALEPYIGHKPAWLPGCWKCQFQTDTGRDSIERQLHALPGKHLVFVHYKPTHNVHMEWVYNEPDLMKSQITWARQLNPASDRELAALFHGRQIWVLDADARPAYLVPYDRARLEKPWLLNPRGP